MTVSTNQDTAKASGWWAIPKEKQEQIKACLPEQDEWTFKAYRVSDHAWAIDVPEAETYGELLGGGTNVAMDEHFLDIAEREAMNGDEMMITCSIKPTDIITTILHKIKDDDMWKGSAYYQEAIFGTECWLCPFTNLLWGHSPKEIYLHLQVLS